MTKKLPGVSDELGVYIMGCLGLAVAAVMVMVVGTVMATAMMGRTGGGGLQNKDSWCGS